MPIKQNSFADIVLPWNKVQNKLQIYIQRIFQLEITWPKSIERDTLPGGYEATDFEYVGRPAENQDDFRKWSWTG